MKGGDESHCCAATERAVDRGEDSDEGGERRMLDLLQFSAQANNTNSECGDGMRIVRGVLCEKKAGSKSREGPECALKIRVKCLSLQVVLPSKTLISAV